MSKLKIFIIVVLAAILVAGIYFYIKMSNGVESKIVPMAIMSDDNKNEESSGIENTSSIANSDSMLERAVGTLGSLTLPSNFNMSVFAQDLGKVRVLKFDPKGNLLASLDDKNRVVAINDIDGDGKGEMKTLIIDLKLPHGIALNCDGKLISKGKCDLYIAETDKVSLYAYDPEGINAVFVKKLFNLPAESPNTHFTRTIEIINYKGKPQLFTSVGSSCNVCNEKNSQRASVLISNLDGSNLRIFSSGLRNAVFFEQKPGSEDIWATEMGRDQLGDNIPPDEIDVLQDGGFYGWPICYDDKIQDKAFDASDAAAQKCAKSIMPKVKLQAHSAPLGLDFTPDSWPKKYRGDLLVSLHGSTNRSEATGYKVVKINLDKDGNYVSTEDFITGWISKNNKVFGRPVDIETNGSDMYISDDRAGVIYKVSPK